MEKLIIASVLIIIAAVSATGILDFIFVNYGPGYVNGKFRWLKLRRYKKHPSRIMLSVLLSIAAMTLLAEEYLSLSEGAAIAIIIVSVIACAIFSFRIIERD